MNKNCLGATDRESKGCELLELPAYPASLVRPLERYNRIHSIDPTEATRTIRSVMDQLLDNDFL